MERGRNRRGLVIRILRTRIRTWGFSHEAARSTALGETYSSQLMAVAGSARGIERRERGTRDRDVEKALAMGECVGWAGHDVRGTGRRQGERRRCGSHWYRVVGVKDWSDPGTQGEASGRPIEDRTRSSSHGRCALAARLGGPGLWQRWRTVRFHGAAAAIHQRTVHPTRQGRRVTESEQWTTTGSATTWSRRSPSRTEPQTCLSQR